MARSPSVGSDSSKAKRSILNRAVAPVARAQRRMFTEVLEKRILLSSYDLSTAGAAHSVESGLNQFGGKVESFLSTQSADNASFINDAIPLVLTAQNGALVAPRLQDVIATPVDLDGDGHILTAQESLLHSYDTSPSGWARRFRASFFPRSIPTSARIQAIPMRNLSPS